MRKSDFSVKTSRWLGVVGLVLLGWGQTPQAFGGDHRIFTTTSGTSIPGELVAVEGGFVTIKRDDDGKLLKVSADTLCSRDIAFLQTHGLGSKETGAAGVSAPTVTPPTAIADMKSGFPGSKWRAKAWSLSFDQAGSYHETWYSEKFEGNWVFTSGRKVVAHRSDGRHWEFTLSDDGLQLVRNDGSKFALVNPDMAVKPIISGSTWKMKDWVMDFSSTGGYHEVWQGHTFLGSWTIGADQEIDVTLDNGKAWKFSLSADGKHLTRNADGYSFELSK